MTIDTIQFAGLNITDSRSGGQYHYTLRAQFRLMTTVGGKLEVIEGLPLQLCREQGWKDEIRTDLHYDETANGGSPGIVDVGTASMQWIGAQVAALQAKWVGAEVTADVVLP